jgi:hypothetical protein
VKTTKQVALSVLVLGVALGASGCFFKKAKQPASTPPRATQTHAGYELPFAIGPVPEQPVAAASGATGAPSTTAYSATAVPNPFGPAPAGASSSTVAVDTRCADDAASVEDCRAAYQALAQAGHADRTLEVYERLCTRKEKLQGCGAFKSKAVGAGDRPTMAQLAMCEAGAWEHCEDATTKVAALVAWRTTLKAQGCKAGANALCANYKQCKGRAQWGCMAASAGEVCGCIPRCDTTALAKAAGKRSWPDGTARGLFECAPTR